MSKQNKPMLTDIVGKKFGRLLVIEPTRRAHNTTMYLCRCDCGNEKEIRRWSLLKNNTTSCGCLRKDTALEISDKMIGQIFGRLTIIGHAKIIDRRTFHLCRCECGNEKEVRKDLLKSKHTISCGCALEEQWKKQIIDLTGKIFGILTVIEQHDSNDHGLRWKCLCGCGETKIIQGHKLVEGEFKSCGCQRYNLDHMRYEQDTQRSNARHVYINRYNDGDLTFEQFIILSQQNCFYCGDIPQSVHNQFKRNKTMTQEEKDRAAFIYNGLDRVDSNGNHDLYNIVPCCIKCNRMKMDTPIEEFHNNIIKIYNEFVLKNKILSVTKEIIQNSRSC